MQRFVSAMRRRDGIIPPVNHEALKYNRGRFPESRYLAGAREVAEAYWDREIPLGPVVLASVWGVGRVLGRLARVRVPKVDFRALLRFDSLVETSARIITRHIVADMLEVAAPLPLPLAAVRTLGLDAETEMVVAVVAPGENLEDVQVELRRQFEELTKRQGSRLPTTARRTVWLRFVARTLRRRKQLPPRGKWAALAEWAVRIWGEGAPDAEAIRKVNGYYEQVFKPRFLQEPPAAGGPAEPEK